MYISRFTVHGLAGRSEAISRTLNPGINAFFGMNGTGKTSLLRILHSAMANDTELLLTTAFDRAEVFLRDPKHEQETKYVLDKEELLGDPQQAKLFYSELPPGTGSALRYRRELARRFAWKISPARPEVPSESVDHIYLPTTRLFLPSPGMRGEDIESMLAEGFERTLREYWVSFFSVLQSQARQAQEHGLADILREVIDSGPSKSQKEDSPRVATESAFTRTRAFLGRHSATPKQLDRQSFEKKYQESGLLQNVVAHIVKVEERIEGIMAPQTRLAALLKKLFQQRKTFDLGPTSIEIHDALKRTVDLKHLSSGEKHVLFILIETLRAGDGPLLIDEPELSMHVDWQSELPASMHALNPKCQLLLATHSPEILSRISDECIFSL